MGDTAYAVGRRASRLPDTLGATASLWTLTTLAVWVEVGLCVHLLARHVPLWQIGVVLALYHAGYVAARGQLAVRILKLARGILIAGAAMLAIGIAISSVVLLAGGAVVFSTAAQTWRRSLKPLGRQTTALKNGGKAAAMSAAALFALNGAAPAWVFAAVSLGAAAALNLPAGSTANRGRPASGNAGHPSKALLLAEALHHTHYFAYVYLFWALSGLAPGWVGPSFVLGWLPYFVLERELTERSRTFSPWLFVGGHLVCAAALVVMTTTDNTTVMLGMWMVTGLGGGTAHMLGNAGSAGNRELYEDGGHVTGCLIGATAAAAAGSATGATAAAAVLAAAAAAALGWHVISKRARHTS